MLRLDRFLSEETPYSRSEIKKMIRAGRVSLNGKCDVMPETKTDPERDLVLLDGLPVTAAGRVCLMMNKPPGVISATEDGRAKTVIDLVHEPYAGRLFPAGRLDKDTEGLLLLTNDGMLAHNLLSPGKHVSKTYFAVITGEPDEELVSSFREGIDIGEKRLTLPAQLLFLPTDGILPDEAGPEEPSDKFIPDEADPEESAGADPAGCGKDREMPSGAAGPEEMRELCRKALSPADYARCGEGECCAAVSVTEGKFHQIKRMFLACGREVRFLKRIAMGALLLDSRLESGACRPLTEEEWELVSR